MPAKKAPKKTPPVAAPAPKTANKKTPPKKAAAKQVSVKQPKAKQNGSYYVSFATLGATISTEKPRGIKSPPAFDTFDQARAAAVDALVEAIEAAETQLLALKRATSPEDLLAT